MLLLEVLLDFGANPNELDGKSESPLYLAVTRGHYEAAALLLKAKAEPNFMSYTGTGENNIFIQTLSKYILAGKSPLTQAVMQDNIKLTELILGNGGRSHCSQYLLHHGNTIYDC